MNICDQSKLRSVYVIGVLLGGHTGTKVESYFLIKIPNLYFLSARKRWSAIPQNGAKL